MTVSLDEFARPEPVNTEAEIKRYAISPTGPMGCLVGKMVIEKLVENMKKNQTKLDTKALHDKLLSLAAVPIEPLRRSVPGTNQKSVC